MSGLLTYLLMSCENDVFHCMESVVIEINHCHLSSIQISEELLFLKAVSLCHTVQISYDQPDCLVGAGDPFSHVNGFSTNHMEYYASSPDEKALVEAAKR